MQRLPSTLVPHPPLARQDQLVDAPDTPSVATAPDAPTGQSHERPCHLPIAWAARPDLDHGHRRSA